MPDTPAAPTEDSANAASDAGHPARAADDPASAPTEGMTNEPLPASGEDPDVGLAQKGTGEAAVVRRETEI